MASQGVTSAFKFTKSVDNKKVPTGHIVLTFNLYNHPEQVVAGWSTVLVKDYFPNPLRCKVCQRLGHTKNRCTGKPTCYVCNLPPHTPVPCTRTMCVNCEGVHPSNSNECPRYIQEKQILEIKTKQKCSISEARRLYNKTFQQINPSKTYASQIRGQNSNSTATEKNANTTEPPSPQNKTIKSIPSLPSNTNQSDLAPAKSTSNPGTSSPPNSTNPVSENDSSIDFDTQPSKTKPSTSSSTKNPTNNLTTSIQTQSTPIKPPTNDETNITKLPNSPITIMTKDLILKSQYYTSASAQSNDDSDEATDVIME
ncbi:mucin-2-like [Episyrphus balteatus]|uniref:mucin-2-like n=1 Tax=Episyrphus balteatus TaxID=286459 RepID=UPI0024854357|nr:mucin-2-like [Episyrphus balteatus]